MIRKIHHLESDGLLAKESDCRSVLGWEASTLPELSSTLADRLETDDATERSKSGLDKAYHQKHDCKEIIKL